MFDSRKREAALKEILASDLPAESKEIVAAALDSYDDMLELARQQGITMDELGRFSRRRRRNHSRRPPHSAKNSRGTGV